MSDFDTVSLLAKEYFQIQNVLESFDDKALTIKGWAVSIALAGVATAFIKANKLVLVFSGASSLLFWVIEGIWKTFAWAYTPRIELIEAALKQENVVAVQQFLASNNFHHLQIHTSWWDAWNSEAFYQFIYRMWKWNVVLPHLAIFFACILLWFCWGRLVPKVSSQSDD